MGQSTAADPDSSVRERTLAAADHSDGFQQEELRRERVPLTLASAQLTASIGKPRTVVRDSAVFGDPAPGPARRLGGSQQRFNVALLVMNSSAAARAPGIDTRNARRALRLHRHVRPLPASEFHGFTFSSFRVVFSYRDSCRGRACGCGAAIGSHQREQHAAGANACRYGEAHTARVGPSLCGDVLRSRAYALIAARLLRRHSSVSPKTIPNAM